MKRLLLYALLAAMAFPVLAELQGDGYYRVQNAYTKRYAYLLDNKGSYNEQASSADVGALELYLDKERILSDPSTVFYLAAASRSGYYDICGQGTSIHAFMNEYLGVLPVKQLYDGKQAYYVYAAKSGISKYLGDRRAEADMDKGLASVDCKGDERKWFFDPLSADSDQYFGVLPTVNAQGVNYAPFFADFPISIHSEGMKIYAVIDIDTRGGAIIKETNGSVPSSTPVIIECVGTHPSENRLNIGGQAETINNNKLKGVYFDNASVSHHNRTPFDKETMRVLGVGRDGRLAFVKGDYDFIPRNQAYLQLTDPNQYGVEEFLVLTEEQRDKELSVVSVIPESTKVDVYGLDGRLIRAGVAKEDVQAFGRGLYILRSGNFAEKVAVR